MKSVRALLSGLIDYAGMFPPAALGLPAAVRNYAAYRRGEHNWVLGRFVLPAAQLGELHKAGWHEADWKVSVIGMANAECVELKPESPADIRAAEGTTAYFEIPIERDPSEWISAVAEAGARAKIRTGGLTADKVPEPSAVARFLALAARARLPFKATAGLHHPLRGIHRFTYEADSPRGTMHGFLNVFLAAALVYRGGSEDEATALLSEQSPGEFRFDNDGVAWRGIRLGVDQLRSAREQFAISFGSCSFEEPISELQSMGLL